MDTTRVDVLEWSVFERNCNRYDLRCLIRDNHFHFSATHDLVDLTKRKVFALLRRIPKTASQMTDDLKPHLHHGDDLHLFGGGDNDRQNNFDKITRRNRGDNYMRLTDGQGASEAV